MKTERKMLISIALIVIMLLNCMLPIFQVNAATSTEIVFNSNLYQAIKKDLSGSGIDFKYDDTTRKIVISTEVIATITRLNLNSSGISDLTGLENFTSLNHLELSGNNLTKDSNLAAIANLPLNYLDLSTNKLEDVSAIDGLINTIESANGKVILTNQTVTIVKIVEQQEDGKLNIELPKILEKAGFIKSAWQSKSGSGIGLDIEKSNIDATTNVLNSIDTSISGTGMLGYYIYIHDDETEAASAANLNRAETNALKESRFTVYLVSHGENQTGIYIPDSNLYKEIKRQLTAGMIVELDSIEENPNGNTKNKDLESYPYKVDVNGEIVYDECTYEVVGGVKILSVDGTRKYVIDPLNGKIYLYDASRSGYRGTLYTQTFERAIIAIKDPTTGTYTYKEGYKVAINGENDTLYDYAYDSAKVFVINNQKLMNKITSLMLNNKQIRDLTGIEYFVGLKSNLDVSQNYLTNIEPVYNMQSKKDEYQSKLQAKYSEVLSSRDISKGGNLNLYLEETKKAKEDADKNKKDIENAMKNAISKIAEGAKISATKLEGGKIVDDPEYDDKINKVAEAVDEILKAIYDHDETDSSGAEIRIKGYETLLQENLDLTAKKLGKSYDNLEELYDIYNNEYRLLTLLTDEMNYMDFPEYISYNEKTQTRAGIEGLVSGEMSALTSFESQNAFTYFEKKMIESKFSGVDFKDETGEKTLAKYFSDYQEATGTVDLGWLDVFREIALYSEMANYCLVKRMNDDTTSAGICYCEEYLKNRIKEFKDDNVNTELEERLLGYLEAGAGDALYNVYKDYVNYSNNSTGITGLLYTDTGSVYKRTCSGEYDRVTGFDHEIVEYSESEIIGLEEIKKVINETNVDSTGATVNTYPDAVSNVKQIYKNLKYNTVKNIDLFEMIKSYYKGQANDLYLYDEATAIATRFVNSNVSRYVILPKLIKLDISYNADLEGIERLGELTSLRTLYANSDYISDISNTDWNAITYLRKLGLSYNFITDIRPLEGLKYLEDLDVSKNLLSGQLKFNFESCQDSLKNLNLSYNQIDDITDLLIYLDMISGGNYSNYLAREDTVNVDLGHQTLNIEKDIIATDNTVVNVDLPIIFTQLLAIDTDRTTCGEQSSTGRSESEGKYVTFKNLVTGTNERVVDIRPDEGNGYDTCVGNGTTCTVKCNVGQINSVDIKDTENNIVTGTTVEVGLDETKQFIAEVSKTTLSDTVKWDIVGEHKTGTTIDQNGLLTVAADEELDREFIIRASSTVDTLKDAEVTIKVVQTTDKYEVKINADALEKVVLPDLTEVISGKIGRTEQFTANVKVNDVEDPTQEVIWEISGNSSTSTNIDDNGLLTIAPNEIEGTELTITAKAKNCLIATDTIKIRLEVPRKYEVIINEEGTYVAVGKQHQFTASVKVDDVVDPNEKVTWAIEGTDNSAITPNGVLMVGENEEVGKVITIIATSVSHPTISVRKDVTVELLREVYKVTIKAEKTQANPGEELGFTAEVEGTANLDDSQKKVTWEVSGATSNLTAIDPDTGKLTIGKNEIAEKLKVKATSVFDDTKSDEIEISLVEPKVVESIKITSDGSDVIKGTEKQFSAEVIGKNLEDSDQKVIWSVEAPDGSSKTLSTDTKIDENGKLTVSSNEENTQIIIKATSNTNNEIIATITINVKEAKAINGIKITPETASVEKGKTQDFSVEVTGNNLEDVDKKVTWSVEAKDTTKSVSADTTITKDGKLTIASDEVNKELVVKATSTVDNTKVAEATVKVLESQPSIGLGYKVANYGEEAYVYDVETKLPVNVFKEKLAKEYTVILKTDEDKKEVTDGIVKTGMWVYIYDKNNTTEPLKDDNGNYLVYQVVVKGDINGDGVADGLDSKYMKAIRNEVGSFEDIQIKAADINNDGRVDTEDAKLLLYHRAEIGKDYTFDYIPE